MGVMKKMLETLGEVDAILCIAGDAKWAPYCQLPEEDFHNGLSVLEPGGSITLKQALRRTRIARSGTQDT